MSKLECMLYGIVIAPGYLLRGKSLIHVLLCGLLYAHTRAHASLLVSISYMWEPIIVECSIKANTYLALSSLPHVSLYKGPYSPLYSLIHD